MVTTEYLVGVMLGCLTSKFFDHTSQIARINYSQLWIHWRGFQTLHTPPHWQKYPEIPCCIETRQSQIWWEVGGCWRKDLLWIWEILRISSLPCHGAAHCLWRVHTQSPPQSAHRTQVESSPESECGGILSWECSQLLASQ